MKFSYVDITTKGCEGWLNLFFGDYCVALIDDIYIANKIREVIPQKNASQQSQSSRQDYICPTCGAIVQKGSVCSCGTQFS